MSAVLQGLNNLAVVYTAQGRVAEALQLLQGALTFNTTCAAVNPHILQPRTWLNLCLTAESDCALSNAMYIHSRAGRVWH